MSDQKPLSEAEKEYQYEKELYDRTVHITKEVSFRQGGIKADGRGTRASKLFNRQTLAAFSLQRLLPEVRPEKPEPIHYWDLSSVALLCRSLVEGFVNLQYYGLEKVNEEDADLRFKLLQLHRNQEKYNLFKEHYSSEEREAFESGIPVARQAIKDHPYLSHLKSHQQKRALQFREVYKSKEDYQKEFPLCKSLLRDYQLLSNWSHPLPLFFESMSNERRRGDRVDGDVHDIMVSMMVARRYLAGSTLDFLNFFKHELGIFFRNEMTELRELTEKGFENT